MERGERRPWQTSGMLRLRNAIHHQLDGIQYGLRHDAAIRQVSMASIALCILALLLPVTKLECLLLVLSSIFVALVEYINSAIEAAIDRISLESHPLSKQAKDFGSVAVGIAVLMCGACWTVIAGPLLLTLSR